MSKDAREQQIVADQLRAKLSDKAVFERDCKNVQDRLSRNHADTSAAQELASATERLRRVNDEIDRLKSQL